MTLLGVFHITKCMPVLPPSRLPQLVTVLLIKVLDNCSCDTGQSVAFVANNSEVVLCLQKDIYLFI